MSLLSTFRRLAVVGLLAALLAGCGDSTTNPTAPTELDQQSADDLAMQTGLALDAVGTEFETMVLTATGPAPSAVQPEHAGHDTTIVRGNMTFVMSRTFYDAGGQVLDERGPSAVRMIAAFRAYGTREGAHDTTQVGRAAMHDLRGIEQSADTLRMNSTSSDTLMNRFRSLDGQRQRYFFWESAMTANDIRVPKVQDAFPTSGTITIAVRAEQLRSGERGDLERRINAVITVVFDGTMNPVVTVNGRWRYRWNMNSGLVTRAG